VVATQLRVGGRLLGVVGCHLSLVPERRVEEVRRVVAAAAMLRGPVVLAGDLNERPDGPSWAVLRAAGFEDPGADPGRPDWETFPADAPRRRIDALLVRGDVRVLEHGDPGVATDLLTRASDHRPVLAELEV
jgi:endonuclease/exonuclease/phosphatase family metal-dependent hydrolase